MKLHTTLLSLAALLSLAGSSACAVQPGDYVIIRVANAESVLSPSCFADGVIPDSIRDDRTTLRTGASVALFAADRETYLLELAGGGVVLEGSRDGSDYSFKGETVDVGEDSTETELWDVDMTITNKQVVGTSTNTLQCVGEDCGITSCVETTDFIGTIVRGVDLEYPL